MRRGTVLATAGFLALLTAACRQGTVLCLEDFPPALLVQVQSAESGERLDSLSGSVTSAGVTRDLICSSINRVEACNGWASGATASIHVERPGYAAWDTTNVQIDRSVGLCPRPILKTITVVLHRP